jgi:hypothetical protein
LGLDTASVPASALDGGAVTFAPTNTKELIPIPEPKSDYFGIGFVPTLLSAYGRGHTSSDAASDVYRMVDVTNKSRGGSKGSLRAIHRAASGFAIDDDADDIYDADVSLVAHTDAADDHISSSSRLEEVDFDADDDGEREGSDLGERRKKMKLSEALQSYLKSSEEADMDRSRGTDASSRPLEGFVLALSIQEKPTLYPSIVVPSDFKPFHIFSEDSSLHKSSSKESNRSRLTLLERTRMLDESRALDSLTEHNASLSVAEAKCSSTSVDDSKSSVFAMLSEQSREKIRVALQQQSPVETSSQPATTASAAAAPSFRPMLTKPNVAVSVFSGVSAAFKNRFTSATIGDRTEQRKESVEVPSEGLWSADYQGERKSSGAVDMKEGVIATSVNVALPAPPPAPMKVLAPRLSSAWSPHPLLCKRMNIPVPDASKHIPHYGQDTSQAVPVLSREENIFRQHIGQHLSGHPEFQPPVSIPAPHPGAVRDDAPEARPEKPPVSLFKSIFESNTSDSESETDESLVEEASSNIATNVPQPARIIGPSKPSDDSAGSQRLSERHVHEPMNEVVESAPAVGRIVFKKPVPKSGILTFESAKPGRRYREHGAASAASGSHSIGKPSKILSFMDEFEDDEPFEDRGSVATHSVEPVAPSYMDSSLISAAAIAAAYPTIHPPSPDPDSHPHPPPVAPDDSSVSSTSSSSPSDSDSDESLRPTSRSSQPSAVIKLAVGAADVARFQDKLSSLLEAESTSRKEQRKNGGKSKKEKKKSKKTKKSKKDRKHRDESKRDRKSKKDHRRRD